MPYLKVTRLHGHLSLAEEGVCSRPHALAGLVACASMCPRRTGPATAAQVLPLQQLPFKAALDEPDDRGVGPAQDSVAMIALAASFKVAAVALDILPFFHCV